MWTEDNTQEELVKGVLRHGPAVLDLCQSSADLSKYIDTVVAEHLDYPVPTDSINPNNWFIPRAYQIYKFGTNVEINFLEFPENETPAGVGKVTLELYSDGSSKTITFKSIGGLVYKKNATFPGTLTLTSATDPVIIEVWRYKSGTIFLNYVGVFT